MIKQDFILLILNCKKYKKKAILQKNTWLKNIPNNIKYYHVIGIEELSSSFKLDDENKILFVKSKDDYNSLPDKITAGFKAIQETYDFKYIFKTDDDQTLINNTFFNTLINILIENYNTGKRYNYGGKLCSIQTHISEYYKKHSELPRNNIMFATNYCTGRFYFLSNESVSNILSQTDKIKKEYLEDYAIGYYLSKTLKKNALNIESNRSFIDYNEPSRFKRNYMLNNNYNI